MTLDVNEALSGRGVHAASTSELPGGKPSSSRTCSLHTSKRPESRAPKSAGRASLEVKFVAGESTVVSSFATSPMKLLAPRSRGPSVWAYTSSFGGGLVAGDQTRLEVQLRPGTRCFLGTQASTKIYRNPAALPSAHETRAMLESGSLLVFVPDPVQAFARSVYSQRQQFHLVPDSNLVLLDWFTSGRVARGERWEFSRFASRNEVRVDSRCVFLDSLLLSPDDGELGSTHRLGRFNCLATLLIVGPQFHSISANLIGSLKSEPVTRRPDLVFSASRVADGVVLRVAATSVEAVGRKIHRILTPIAELLGDDPWARKW